MTAETVTLTFSRYRTPAGEPTCAFSFAPPVTACEFIGMGSFGTTDQCCYGTPVKLERRPDYNGVLGMGYLTPHKRCPLWVDK